MEVAQTTSETSAEKALQIVFEHRINAGNQMLYIENIVAPEMEAASGLGSAALLEMNRIYGIFQEHTAQIEECWQMAGLAQSHLIWLQSQGKATQEELVASMGAMTEMFEMLRRAFNAGEHIHVLLAQAANKKTLS